MLACGIWLWLVGLWSHAARHRGFYAPRVALVVFERTPLCLSLPVYWQAQARRFAQRRRAGSFTLTRTVTVPRLTEQRPHR